MKEIRSIIKNKKYWKAIILFKKKDPRINKLSEDEYMQFILLVDLAESSL